MKFFAILPALFLSATGVEAENWPMWRGPRLDGTSSERSIPTNWGKTENIGWKTPLPGSGHASPIVWNDRVLTVAADENTQARLLLCFDRKNGALLWQRTVVKAVPEPTHRLNSLASSTPATDGERIFTAFLEGGRVVVAAHDFQGEEIWLKRPGVFSSIHGFCSSPVLYRDKVIVNCDHDGDGYIVALARATGDELWRIDRPNKTRSYCAPLLRQVQGRMQMVVAGSKCVASYNPDDGRLHWIIDGPTEQFVASPVYHEQANFFFITAGYPEHHILAIRPDGTGNVTGTHIAWRTIKGAAYVPSPIAEGKYFLVVSDSGIAHCFEAATGQIVWQERLGEQHASLVSANGLVYFLNDKGVMNVVRPGPKFELVGQNEIGESTFASPALSEGQLFLRGDHHLFCIGEKKK